MEGEEAAKPPGWEAGRDAQDRLVSYGPHAYAYGPNGELETRTGPEPLDLTTDVFGNLRTATTADADVDYVADPKGRRVERRVDGLRTAGWLWRSQLAPAAELDEAGAVARRYVYTDGVNVPDLVVDVPTGARWRLVKDQLGTVRRVVDVASGAIVRGLDFDSFGRVLAASGDEEAVPFGFAGGLWDAETGLVRFGAREYDAETGRFTAKDPIRFRGGDTNIYAYVANDSVNSADPSGLLITGVGSWLEWIQALLRDLREADDLHRTRNRWNRCPARRPRETGDQVCSADSSGDGSEYDSEGREWEFSFGKLRGSDGSECNYDSNGDLLPNSGESYNFCADPLTPCHGFADFGYHHLFGSDYADY